ncbi:MAG: lysophospholipid acyltransferase family protein [Cyanobacteria bacterium J06597_1]
MKHARFQRLDCTRIWTLWGCFTIQRQRLGGSLIVNSALNSAVHSIVSDLTDETAYTRGAVSAVRVPRDRNFVSSQLPVLPPVSPLQLSNVVLRSLQVNLSVTDRDNIPEGPLIVISNHRSILDPFVLMVALQRDIRFACHFFMTRVPLLNLAIARLNCIPLEQHGCSQAPFFRTALSSLRSRETVGIFPEGGALMTRRSTPHHIAEFQPGFAHLALRSRLSSLAILPVALKVHRDLPLPDLPMSVFRWFDPVEPAFQTRHPHPVVLYRKATVAIAPPIWLPLSSPYTTSFNPVHTEGGASAGDRHSVCERSLDLKRDAERLTHTARRAIQQLLNE